VHFIILIFSWAIWRRAVVGSLAGPAMDGLTTFSATNFFYYSLPFKVIDQRTPPPYDSTSALHGLTTFQKPTTTLSGDMAILPSFGYYFYFLCSEMSVKIFIKCALANKNSYNTTNCAL